MKKHIIISTVIVLMLVITYMWDSKAPKTQKSDTQPTYIQTIAEEKTVQSTPTPTILPAASQAPKASPLPSQETIAQTEVSYAPNASEAPTATPPAKYMDTKTPETLQEEKTNISPAIIPDSTDVVIPHSQPEPDEEYIETDTDLTSDQELMCTLCVKCDSILNLKSESQEFIPEQGIIFAEKEVVFYEGESVFNVLLREMQQNKIHLEFVNTPIYNSTYIEGIHNIYEFDYGELSGWMYKVNDWFPNYSCSKYILSPGDRIEFLYTCNLGKDIGGYNNLKTGE